jgi:hypothetical protein
MVCCNVCVLPLGPVARPFARAFARAVELGELLVGIGKARDLRMRRGGGGGGLNRGEAPGGDVPRVGN